MIVIGVTGSIGMGKTTAAEGLRRLGIPVFEADREVHCLLDAKNSAVAAAFPAAIRGGAIDRRLLGEIVFRDEGARKRLESILHPLVRAAELRFLRQQVLRRRQIAALDIPLLFETGADRLCDASVVVTAPVFLQRARVLSRPGMTPERFQAILALQMADANKRRLADFVLPAGLGERAALNRLRLIVRLVRRRRRARNRSRYRNHRA